MKTVILDVRTSADSMADFVRVWKTGKAEKSARISFATPELLAALPADAQQPVTQVTVTNDKTKDVASVSTPSHGAIASASVFPNPSHGNISVHVNLQADRTISLRLLDLSGKELVRQSGSSITPKGGADLRLDASAVGEGVYILDVTSDVGEHSFSKVMIIR